LDDVGGLAAVKLILSIATFAVLGYLGKSHDKRIAGVLLTFPILNGIGILTAHDPLAAANSIYAVVIYNGLLLFLAISYYRVLPPLPEAASPHLQLVARVLIWTVLWSIGAVAIVIWRDALPGPGTLLVVTCVIAGVATVLAWKPANHDETSGRDFQIGMPAHARGFMSFWSNAAGGVRLSLFAFCCILLLVAANVFESKWVGMLSALPLPGLFAVATLSTLDTRDELVLVRDTVLWGPVNVVAFNWIFAEIVARLPAEPGLHSITGLALLVMLLALDAALIFRAVPRIADFRDGRKHLRTAAS
jgi:hypothetical protein